MWVREVEFGRLRVAGALFVAFLINVGVRLEFDGIIPLEDCID